MAVIRRTTVHTEFDSLLEKDRQYMYNVTLRRVRATTVAVEKQKVLHILSVCLWP
jgi:hypothetical protein